VAVVGAAEAICDTDPMRVLSIVHEREAGSGVFAEVAGERGDEVVEWIPAARAAPQADSVGAVLVFGGAMNVDEESEHGWLGGEKELLREFLLRGTPALGVCLGAQLLAEVAGGGARRAATPEIGWITVELTLAARDDALLGPLPGRFESFQWHSYELSAPPDAVRLARSAACLQGFRLSAKPWWGIQFHAEVTEETIAGWIEDYRSDQDAVRADLDWAAILGATRNEIESWTELGRGICRRFLDSAAREAPT
jgi:GMP synthase-like glutamine amidotransferase